MSNPGLQQIVNLALDKRCSLMESTTNLIRLIDGEGDRLPGCYLERFGEAWLISTSSPKIDPLLCEILSEYHRPLYWKRLDQHQKQSPTHLSGPLMPQFFLGVENNLNCRLSFDSGYSQGVFIDQRENRAQLKSIVQPGSTVLNTFSYTGFFSVAAASNGATTTTLDLSQVYLDWARENFRANQIPIEEHYFCKGDTFHWLQRFAKQGRKFDAIILDPPTFSRDHKGKVFRVERDFPLLFDLAIKCLAPHGTILSCTNFRGLSAADFMEQLKSVAPRHSRFESHPMPEDFTGPSYLKSIWSTHA